ncbi:MAG: DEAD/DEAH box helicase, partial [Chloroflexota bacterium]|nr:DEAD/DEAH box helicase [Chloroflexota bacterium]
MSTLRDLLYFFPHRHVDYSQIRPIARLEIEVEQTVMGFVWEASVKHLGRTGRGTEAIIGDDTGNLKARWYHQPYLAQKLRPNTRVVLSGKIAIFRGQKVMESPELEFMEGEELIHTGRLVPVYPLTEGLSPRTVRRLTKEALDRFAPSWPDFLPQVIKEQAHPSTGSGHRLLDLPQALRQAHFPDSPALKDLARQRLAFDELFLIQLGMIGRKRQWQQGQSAPVLEGEKGCLHAFLASLPFSLTSAQERVMKEIRDDLSRDRPMSRLLQGEVGSGKTVVATAALLLAATSGYQASFMAPTEILAEQHFQSLGRLLSGLPHPAAEGHLLSIRLDPWPRPILLGLLTGGLKEREKEDLRGLIAQGAVDIVIGTHALIEREVEFAKLGLAVIDEQHR